MRHQLVTAALTAAALLLGADAALAHEEITPPSFATGRPIFLTLAAANEKRVDLVMVTLAAPAGAPIGETTRQPVGWAVERGEGTITWSGGAVKPGSFEQWGFEVEGADQPGRLTYRVTLAFAGGDTEESDVVVDALAPGATPTTGAAPSVGVPTTVSPATTGAIRAAAPTSEESGKANAALVVAIMAAVLAVAAMALAARRRSAPARAVGPVKPEQDF